MCWKCRRCLGLIGKTTGRAPYDNLEMIMSLLRLNFILKLEMTICVIWNCWYDDSIIDPRYRELIYKSMYSLSNLTLEIVSTTLNYVFYWNAFEMEQPQPMEDMFMTNKNKGNIGV